MSFVLQRASFDPMVVSWIGTAIAVSYAAYLTYTTSKRSASGGASGGGQINPGVKKDTAKVVDSFDMEDLGKKAVFCRCWRSKKFPYCDGAHAKHNEATGDNVGPLIIQDSNPK